MKTNGTQSNATSTVIRPSAQEPLLRSRDVIARLAISRKLFDSLISSGRLPSIRIGRNLRFDPATVRQFLAEATTGRLIEKFHFKPMEIQQPITESTTGPGRAS
jgi:excisionase family DNA binding protein